MRLYRVVWTVQTGADSYKGATEWFGSIKEAKGRATALRIEHAKDSAHFRLHDGGLTNIPTDKAGLLKWLNTNVNGHGR